MQAGRGRGGYDWPGGMAGLVGWRAWWGGWQVGLLAWLGDWQGGWRGVNLQSKECSGVNIVT